MSETTAADRHQACHTVDDICTAIARLLNELVEPAYVIGAGAKIDPIIRALQALHDDATAVHEASLREMQN